MNLFSKTSRENKRRLKKEREGKKELEKSLEDARYRNMKRDI